MNQLDAMRIYVRVAELSSFTQAADHLNLPKASISGAVKQLEAQLSTRLLHRTTRSVQMTQDGLLFYQRCKDLLADMDEVQALFQRDHATISGRLRVDLPHRLARSIVIPRLPDFLHAFPRLEIELSSTDRHVDLIREGFDCVLRVGQLAHAPSDNALIARRLGAIRQINCASAGYLQEFGTPSQLKDLSKHRLIHYASHFGGKPVGFEYMQDGQTKTIAMNGSITVNDSDAYGAACLAGLGIVQAPEIGLRALIDSGELVEILPGYTPQAMPVTLLYADRRHLPKRTHYFMNWLAEVVTPHLQISAP
jgi:DNA-binding transcriptional LysR family regulator